MRKFSPFLSVPQKIIDQQPSVGTMEIPQQIRMKNYSSKHRFSLVDRIISTYYQRKPRPDGIDDIVADLGISPSQIDSALNELIGLGYTKTFALLDEISSGFRRNDSISINAISSVKNNKLEDANTIIPFPQESYSTRGRNLQIRYATFDSPYGEYLLACSEQGICSLHFLQQRDKLSLLTAQFPQAHLIADKPGLADQADSLFRSNALITSGHQLQVFGTEFQIHVWRQLIRIPLGQTMTYAGLAQLAQRPNAIRATANCVARNPVSLLIPCHRVIHSGAGGIGNYGGGWARKRALLAVEYASV